MNQNQQFDRLGQKKTKTFFLITECISPTDSHIAENLADSFVAAGQKLKVFFFSVSGVSYKLIGSKEVNKAI